MIFLIFALVLAGIFAMRVMREPRRLSNGIYLMFALLLGALGAMTSEPHTVIPALIGLTILMSPLLVLALAAFLVANGVVMIRREGVSAGNSLSLLAGIALPGVPGAGIFALATGATPLTVAAISVTLVAGYFGAAFTCFLLYAWVYSRLPLRNHPSAIIVLGAGLIDGAVPPLLANRLDRARDLHARQRATGPAPVIVTSGGQGPDEPLPEADAMAAYLHSRGIPESDIIAETRSSSTAENLEFSAALLEKAGVQGDLLIVTSNYHVLRAAVLSRHQKLNAHVTGAPTARYYLPSAFLREFAALMVQYRGITITACVVLGALPPLLYAVSEQLIAR